MSSNVNVTVSNFRATGTNVSVAQRAVDIAATWTNDDGSPGSASQTVLFPNVLANAALPAGWLQRELTALSLRAIRIIAGVDSPQS